MALRFDVAEVGHGDDHVLLDDQVLGGEPLDVAGDLGAPLVAVALLDLVELRHHDVEDLLVAREQRLQVGDDAAQLLAARRAPSGARGRSGAQAHVEDGLGLALREPELALQGEAGGGRRPRRRG